jgi:hypothetical protein
LPLLPGGPAGPEYFRKKKEKTTDEDEGIDGEESGAACTHTYVYISRIKREDGQTGGREKGDGRPSISTQSHSGMATKC